MGVNGFTGRGANHFFERVESALQQGEDVINVVRLANNEASRNKQAQNNGSVGRIMLVQKANSSPVSSGQNANKVDLIQKGTYVGKFVQAVDRLYQGFSPDTIASDNGIYGFAVERTQQMDQEMTEKFQELVGRIQVLCDQDYVIPAATPVIVGMLEELRNMIDQSSQLSQSIAGQTHQFVQWINEEDR